MRFLTECPAADHLKIGGRALSPARLFSAGFFAPPRPSVTLPSLFGNTPDTFRAYASRMISKSNTILSLSSLISLLRGRVPGQVVIQLTDRCNATCAQCGMRVTNRFDRTTLTMDSVRSILDTMVANNMQAVSFTGGEPFVVQKQLIECIDLAGRAGIPFIRTGTNGFMFAGHDKPDFKSSMHNLAEKLAATRLRNFWVSLDSCSPDLHEENRGLPNIVAGMEKALPIFHEHGIYPSANLGINRLTGGDPARLHKGQHPDDLYRGFKTAFGDFFSFVENLGFTIVNCCYPMSMEDEDQAVYAATSAVDMIRFSSQEKTSMFRALYDTLPEYRSRMRLFTPRSSLLSLIRQYQGHPEQSAACRGGIDFFFVDSQNSHAYPCGYRADEDLGKFEDIDFRTLGRTPYCRECDWECFRDPSELTSPLTGITQKPFRLIRRLAGDREYRRALLEDLRYYRACGYFNGREPMDRDRLRAFA